MNPLPTVGTETNQPTNRTDRQTKTNKVLAVVQVNQPPFFFSLEKHGTEKARKQKSKKQEEQKQGQGETRREGVLLLQGIIIISL